MRLPSRDSILMPPPGSAAAQAAEPEFVPNQVLVQFRPDATPAERATARQALGATILASLTPSGDLELLNVDTPVAEAVNQLARLESVEFAEPNFIVRHTATSNDPYYTDGFLWGMYGDGTTPANQFGSQAGELWAQDFTGSSSVFVGVIDEGIDFNHPDLAANVWTNPFDPVDGVDNDGNGRIDDIHGWDFDANDNSVYDGTADDHGTHVAGTIGARGGNGTGVAGVNWNVTMISAKFLNGVSGSGFTSNAVLAVNYLIDLKTRHGLNIIVTSNSWGGGGYSTALHQALIRAAKAGILTVAAAGNSSSDNDVSPNYPSNYATNVTVGSETAASYDAMIAVASITSSGARSSFSNYGATTVDIGAPGSGIYSTTPANTYSSYNGTSMATPHVSGAVALFKSMNPSATAADIRAAILGLAAATPAMSGISVTGGRLNIGGFTNSLPTMSINDVSLAEGASGTTSFVFTVSLSAAAPYPVTADYAATAITATPGVDFTAASGTISFAAGDTSATFSIPVMGDTSSEANETFAVTLSNPAGASIGDASGVGTIVNDEGLFTDPDLTAGDVIKAIHVTELRQRINAVRAARGLTSYTFTDATLTAGSSVLRAIHITELREALHQAYVAAGLTPPTYTDQSLGAGTTARVQHIIELRAAVTAIE